MDWEKLIPSAQRVEVPTYAFQRRRYWLEGPAAVAGTDASADPGSAEFWEAVERNDLDALGIDEGMPSGAVLPALSAWRRG
ncbi:hypothetical protein, partial [Streptomyces sp. IB2014 016-6]|uniref:hypothetical protein n=1 Tax=Streptomyces sp. IB2014 016-6 TaxID=2517818 RepID=UPI0011C9C446